MKNKWDDFFGDWNRGDRLEILTSHEMGVRLREVVDDPETHGANAMQQIADYLGYPGGVARLRQLAKFAQAFGREVLEAEIDKPMANRLSLKLGHFLAVTPVPSQAERFKWLAIAREQCLSPATLAKFIDQDKGPGPSKAA